MTCTPRLSVLAPHITIAILNALHLHFLSTRATPSSTMMSEVILSIHDFIPRMSFVIIDCLIQCWFCRQLITGTWIGKFFDIKIFFIWINLDTVTQTFIIKRECQDCVLVVAIRKKSLFLIAVYFLIKIIGKV